MHVSYRAKYLVVSWKLVRVTERQEDKTVVRERETDRFNHMIPLPEGTRVSLFACREV